MALVAMLELLVLLLILPLAALARALLGGPWPIEVFRDRKLYATEHVRRWSASRERIHDLVAQIRTRNSVRARTPLTLPLGETGESSP